MPSPLPFMIAVDGPAGAGKGTLAKHLGEFYHFAYLDTGLLYRAVAYEMIQDGDDLTNANLAEEVALSLNPATFKESSLRDEAIGGAASFISAYPGVRAALLQFQRNFAERPPHNEKGVVLDGRDIGTVILPQAQVKIFVTADLETRAKRRLKEMRARGIECLYEALLDQMKERDTRDKERKISELKSAQDALIIDTSCMTIDEVFTNAKEFVDEKLKIYYDPQAN